MQAPTPIMVGIWQSSQGFQIAWFDDQGIPYYGFSPSAEYGQLRQQIALQTPKLNFKRIKWVSAVHSQKIWHRSLILTTNSTKQEIHMHCKHTLERELPLPIAEIYFDYASVNLDSASMRVDLFAIKRSIAEEYIQKYSPLKLDVLDAITQAIMVAFKYLLPEDNNSSTLFLYQEDQQILGIYPQKTNDLIWCKNDFYPSEFCKQFSQMHSLEIGQVVIWQAGTSKARIPDHWKQIHSEIPLVALGCALWQGNKND